MNRVCRLTDCFRRLLCLKREVADALSIDVGVPGGRRAENSLAFRQGSVNDKKRASASKGFWKLFSIERGGYRVEVAVKTKSVYDPVEASDGKRILVMRYWPRGMKRTDVLGLHGVWIKDLAPSAELLQAYRNNKMSWRIFELKYRREMGEFPARAYIEGLAHGAFGDAVTLLCWERTARCHRFILKNLVEEARKKMKPITFPRIDPAAL